MESDHALHLAMAALVGASFLAASAYYMHRKTLSQLLDFAKATEKGGQKERDDAATGNDKNLIGYKIKRRKNNSSRKNMTGYGRVSASMPDVTRAISTAEINGEETQNGTIVYEIPSGLPGLHEGKAGRRHDVFSHLISPTSPKSSDITASAFGSVVESDDEDNLTYTYELDTTYVHANENDDNANGEQVAISAPRMIRPHSVSTDLHGVQHDPIAADILRKEPEQESFVKLKISPTETPSPEEMESYLVLQECLELRESYVFRESIAPWSKEIISNPSAQNPHYYSEGKSNHFFQMEDGVVQVYANKDSKEKLFPVADATTFFTDLHRILRILAVGDIQTLCHHRLNLLEQKFNVHLMLNADREFLAQKSAPHRDFYNVRKVDTHIHHIACMNQKHLLKFIKSKLRKEPDEVVIYRDGTYLTLEEVFKSLDLTGYDLNVDLLDVHADKSTFHRFDKFNLKYNPCGQSRLREIFLKQDNLIQGNKWIGSKAVQTLHATLITSEYGRFVAELTKQVILDLEASKYQMAEYRISIYGRKQSEWDTLASWVLYNNLYSENVVWLIQIPRIYDYFKDMGFITSFQNMLENIFTPLFEVTVDPDSHPQLHLFLKQVVGLDLVDDESKPERRPTKHMPTPAQWTNIFNPAYSYYVYYFYANLYTLNKLRESKGMTTIKLRPHAGEAGDIDHLAAAFLTATNISHGLNLRKSPVLQYLYYLAQIGLAMSPLSNNFLFLDYHRNPFPIFFFRGLNVSLSTDDPLQMHLTQEPLVEEYSIAASVWKLSSSDICEIARNSVLQSGFSHSQKSHWIGKKYYNRGPDGNDIHKTNVPHIRVEFRHMVWKEEMQRVYLGKAKIPPEIDC